MDSIGVIVAVVACFAALGVFLRCGLQRKKMQSAIETRATERFHELVARFDEAEREAMSISLNVRYRDEQELKLVASSALCVLWHADVVDTGEPDLVWDLRIFAEERGEFTSISEIPEDFRVHAWYYGRNMDQMLKMGENARTHIRGGSRGYRQEFLCTAKDGSAVWFQENTSIENLEEKKWRLFGVSIDITERKKAEEERERILKELRTALADVKQLRGMLPICANCKKIRDDAGYWSQLESYLHEHTDLEFSHSICPECVKKLYPDLNLEG